MAVYTCMEPNTMPNTRDEDRLDTPLFPEKCLDFGFYFSFIMHSGTQVLDLVQQVMVL